MKIQKSIGVWYVAPFTKCNFKCRYCATYHSRNKPTGKYSIQIFQKVIEWLCQLPFKLKIRINTIGEPFLSQDFLTGVSFLSKNDRIEFIELTTNGSFSRKRFESFTKKTNINKISLWITFHHEGITPEKLVNAAKFAQDLGAFVVVHILLFPDSFQVGLKVVGLCKEVGIRTDTTLGFNSNSAYLKNSGLPFLDSHSKEVVKFYRNKAALEACIIGYLGPKGQNCSAGHDYFFIENSGGIFPCYPYARNQSNMLGNFLKDPKFVPNLRSIEYAPCLNMENCNCKEDFLHLQVARSQLNFGPSLGYFFDSCNKSDLIVHVGDASPEALRLSIILPEDENKKAALINKCRNWPIEIRDNKMYIFLD